MATAYVVIDQRCNRVTITDPDDPLTRIVMRIRPEYDPNVNRFN